MTPCRGNAAVAAPDQHGHHTAVAGVAARAALTCAATRNGTGTETRKEMTPMGTKARAQDPARYLLEDLPERIRSRILVNPLTGCWEWEGWRDERWGYGYVWWEGKDRPAHRVVFALLVGPIPDGLTLDHVHNRGCRSKACCWPAHLEPVTTGENTRRFWAIQPRAHRTHCGQRHELTPENTYVRPGGQRQCRECRRMRKRSWADRQKAG